MSTKAKKDLEKEIAALRTKLKKSEANKEVYKTALRSNGFQLHESMSTTGKGRCDCTPIHTYKPVERKYEEFYPSMGCYKCEKCGAPQFCDSCITNYDMKIEHKRNNK